MKDEDLMRENEAQQVKGEVMDNTWTFMDDYAQNVAIRNKQFQASQDFEEKNEEDDEEEDAYELNPIVKEEGNLIFTRQKNQVKLSDFLIRKMIGKGTFGKVFLVQYKDTTQIFAMKCIRKDIIIDNEQFENIKLEKDILFNIDHPFIVNMEYVFQSEFRIYFLMKFIKGGELFRHLIKIKRFHEDQVRFFIA